MNRKKTTESADLCFLGRQPESDVTHVNINAPLAAAVSTLRQAAVYLPTCRASLPFNRCQFILLGDRDTCV